MRAPRSVFEQGFRGMGVFAAVLCFAWVPAWGQTDDHSNTPVGATVLIVNDFPTAGGLLTVEDNDFFEFPGQAGVLYKIETLNALPFITDTKLELHDASGLIAGPVSGGGEDANALIQWTGLTDGPIFVNVLPEFINSLGDYFVSVTSADLPSAPVIDVTPATLDFGAVTVDQVQPNTFTVTNTGVGLLLGSATVFPPFEVVSGSPYSLTAGQSKDVVIQFAPKAVGGFAETASFTGGGDAGVDLTGTGATGGGGVGTGTITGTVINVVGSVPLTCATVVATGSDGTDTVVSTDLDGVYAFVGLPADDYTLSPRSPGFSPMMSFVNLAANETVSRVLDLDATTEGDFVSGSIFDMETGLALAGVRVDSFIGSVLIDTSYTCASGAFEVAVTPPEAKTVGVTILLSAPGFETKTLEDPAPVIQEGITPKSIVQGGISGSVIEVGSNDPIENASVWVSRAFLGTLSFPIVTGVDGGFLVTNLPAGQYEIKAQATGFEVEEATFTKSTDAEILGVIVEMVSIGGAEGEGEGEGPPPPPCGAGPGQEAGYSGLIGDSLAILAACVLLIGWRRSSLSH